MKRKETLRKLRMRTQQPGRAGVGLWTPLWVSGRSGRRCGGRFVAEGGAGERTGAFVCESAQGHRKAWTKLLMSLSKSESWRRSSLILRTEWMTVEWCFPPKSLPISGREAPVRVLVRYMAI